MITLLYAKVLSKHGVIRDKACNVNYDMYKKN